MASPAQEADPFEWAGSFSLQSGIHTLTLARSKAAYAAPSMKLAILLQGVKTLSQVKEMAHEVFEDEHDHDERREGDCADAANLGTEHCPMTLRQGGNDLSCPSPSTLTLTGRHLSAGGTIMLDGSTGLRAYILEMDAESSATVFKINVATPGTYAIFSEVLHRMTSAHQ